jgi:P-type Cu2+ transporter
MTSTLDIGFPAPTAAARELACAHCGQPVPPAEAEPGVPSFCCAGCRSVYAIVKGSGLAGYYTQLDEGARQPAPSPSARKFQELDDPAFQAEHCRDEPSGMRGVELLLEGIHCSACVWLIERLARVEPSVQSTRLDLSRNVVSVCWDPARAPLSTVARALASLGYEPHALGTKQDELARKRDRELLLRLGLAGAAAGNVMLMGFALYSGAFSGMEAGYAALFRWGSFAIATPSVFWAGWVFLRGGWAAIRTRTPHMDLPVSIGILAGYVGGAVNTLRGDGEIYFDTLCTLIFLLLVGRYLQQSHHRRSTSQSELLLALAPQTARLVTDDGEREVPAAGVAPQALVRVQAGERIPVDGVIQAGHGSVDTSLLTGEPMPCELGVSERVYAGTTCQSGELVIRVECAGTATRLGRLMVSVEQTQKERPPIVRLADKVSGYFVVGILVVAALTFLLWLELDARHAVDHVVALLVVTCPCALGMATPLAVSVALRRAAKAGILFKSGEAVEALARPGVIVFDKTGTLTLGKPELVAWMGDTGYQAPLRALESLSTHPLALAIQRAFPQNDLDVAEVSELPQGGISGNVAGHALLAGSAALVASRIGGLPAWAEQLVSEHARNGNTPVLIVADGTVRAVAAFGDQLRPEARQSLEELHRLGFELHILSGDHRAVVNRVADQLGIPRRLALGEQTPEAKLENVASLREAGQNVIMVGDGVNDAAAMAAARVGIAVHGGAETCLRAADVFTTRDGLQVLVAAATGARRTLEAIRRGIGISLAYNLIGIGLAVLGILTPLWAAILMPLSSISVVSLALRARTFDTEPR